MIYFLYSSNNIYELKINNLISYLIEKNSDIEIKEFNENNIKDFFQNDYIVIDDNKKI